MTPQTNRIEVTLESMIESVDLAERIVMRICDAAGFGEEDSHKIGMSVREAVINAFHYGNRESRDKKIFSYRRAGHGENDGARAGSGAGICGGGSAGSAVGGEFAADFGARDFFDARVYG